MSNILITICARGGSKGCPGKHTRRVNGGETLIGWTMIQAMRWRNCLGNDAKIVVSTDSSAVREVAAPKLLHCVQQRPSPTDETPKVPAIRNALLDAEELFAKRFNPIIDLDATAPLRTLDDIDGCLAELNRGSWDCVLSATVGVGRNPYFNLLEMDNGLKRCKPYIPDGMHGDICTRQEAPQVYEANSSIYVYRRDFLLREDVTSPLDGRCGVYIMPDESFYHVDSELDFKIVEFLMKRRHDV